MRHGPVGVVDVESAYVDSTPARRPGDASVAIQEIPMLVACLIASIFAAQDRGVEASATDYRVLEIVLLKLIDSPDFAGASTRTKIILDDMTLGPPDRLRDPRLDKEFGVELCEELRRRNPGPPVSLAAFKPRSSRILVGALGQLDDPDDLYRAYPEVKGYVQAWLPAYSEDGKTALVRLEFGPTAHGAEATYVLVKDKKNWVVKRRSVAYRK
jgi:hypothetical protein